MLNIRPFLLLPLAFYSLSCATDDPATTTSTNTTTVTTTVTSTSTTTETATTTSEPETATKTTTETTTTPDVEPCTDSKLGTSEGFCGEDFTLLNSAEESISLYDYVGDVILLDLSGFT